MCRQPSLAVCETPHIHMHARVAVGLPLSNLSRRIKWKSFHNDEYTYHHQKSLPGSFALVCNQRLMPIC